MKPLTRVFGVISVLLVASCAQSMPTGPSAPGPTISLNLRGDWQGTFAPVDCEFTNYRGTAPCLDGAGSASTIQLTLTHEDGAVSGTMRQNISSRIPITGEISPGGSIHFSGTLALLTDISAAFLADDLHRVDDWTTTYDKSTGTMSGTAIITRTILWKPSGEIFQRTRRHGTISDLKRVN